YKNVDDLPRHGRFQFIADIYFSSLVEEVAAQIGEDGLNAELVLHAVHLYRDPVLVALGDLAPVGDIAHPERGEVVLVLQEKDISLLTVNDRLRLLGQVD